MDLFAAGQNVHRIYQVLLYVYTICEYISRELAMIRFIECGIKINMLGLTRN